LHDSEDGEFSGPNGSQRESLGSLESALCKRTVRELENELPGKCNVSKLSRPNGPQSVDSIESDLCKGTVRELDNAFSGKYSDGAGKRTFSAALGETRRTG
jgi:hypothetical protein